MKKFYFFLFLISWVTISFAQEVVIKGKVTGFDSFKSKQLPLIGVNIIVKNTTIGVSTNSKGLFTLKVKSLPVDVVFSYIGYKKKTIKVNTETFLNVVLKGNIYSSKDLLVVGSRFRPRTSITSSVPIDNITMEEMRSTSQVSLDKILTYLVPSFNSTQQTISDATAHFDPADLRGLGPSRTLVLINGKRKNPSALVFINDTPGKGDVGVDMNSIPLSAIKRVEILRDGASAQYGSDAIAGVINIILNDESKITKINSYSGVTAKGDGFQIGGSIDKGFKLGNNGFLNVSTAYSSQRETNRAGTPGKDVLFGVGASNPWIQKHPGLGMRVGLPNMKTADIYYNSELNLNESDKIYSFGGIVYRQGLSYALYRTPYWIPDKFFIKHKKGTTYEGFQPTFETSIMDKQFTTGFRSKKNGWNYDISYTFGSNSVDYKVSNSINLSLGELSPTVFNPGGYGFKNHILNFDISKLFFDKLFVSAGSEFRLENFIAVAGGEASYKGGGVQSFPGLQPQNAVDAKRTNIGVYLDIGSDLTENVFVGGAIRYEDYSDFGSNVTYKVSGRVKTSDNRFTFRGSISSGFRAPSLHQIYLSNIQTLVSGGTVSNQGTFNNDSPVLRKLGVNKLKEETSTNYTIGIAGKPVGGFSFSVDYFRINLKDRIVYSSAIFSTDTTTTVGRILRDNSITSLKFFINAVNTITKGIDIVASYRYGKLSLRTAASFLKHSIDGKINTPAVLAADGVDIFDRKEQSRILTARPTKKVVLGLTYNFDPLTVNVSATYFGEVTWRHVNNGLNGVDLGNGPLPTNDAAFDQTFSAKVITDLNFSYKISQSISLGLLVNNLFDVYPDVINTKGDFVTNLGGRFKYPWEVNQFGFNGRVIMGTVNISL
ncbi:MAG TPA: TonB-dependent receptor [Ignavibacteria bacterium]|nr:TonB-dependent receptor [Ignavibacteria bacterium]